jgi:hypothetical protein
MWLHAMIAGPVVGIRSRCSWDRRNQNRSGGNATVFATWNQGSVTSLLDRKP